MALTSNSVKITAELPVTSQSVGGVQANYIKPSFVPEQWAQVFLDGQSVPFSLADVNNDGNLEAVVWSNDGAAKISYYLNGQVYNETVSITSFVSGGTPNNFATLTQIPALNIILPKVYSIDGNAREIIRVGSEVDKVTVIYNTDTLERGELLRTVNTLQQQNTSKQTNIEDLRTQLTPDTNYTLTWKNAVQYNEYYDYVVNIPAEKEACFQENTTFGGWFSQMEGFFNHTIYYSGQSGKYNTQLTQELSSNRYEINTITQRFLNEDAIAVGTTATVSSSGGGGVVTAPLVVDGSGNTETTAVNINPAQFIIDLGSSQYITKILIKGAVEYKVQNLLNLYLSDNPYGTDLDLLTETSPLGNEYAAFPTRQQFFDNNNAPFKDEAGKFFYYLPKKRYVRLNIASVLDKNPTLCEVEVYVVKPSDPTFLTFYDKSLTRYNLNWLQQFQPFGPDNGDVFSFQDNGRSNWATQRALITSNRGPSGSINSREQDIDVYSGSTYVTTQRQAALNISTEPQVFKGQRQLLTETWEKSYTGLLQKYNDMNQLSVDIAKNLNEINLNKAQFVL